MKPQVILVPPDGRISLASLLCGVTGLLLISGGAVLYLARVASYCTTAPLVAAGMGLTSILSWNMRRILVLRRSAIVTACILVSSGVMLAIAAMTCRTG